jgi:hypothetical protein
MRSLRRLLLVASLASMPIAAAAIDNGQFDDVPANIRSWFKSVRSPYGVLCCDITDGHRTTWKADAHGTYWVPIEDRWVPVPPEAIVYDAGNPFGDAVIWYVKGGTDEDGMPTFYIRCFVPGGGV